VSLDDREIPVAELPLKVREMLSGRPADQRVLFLAADDRLNYEGVLRIVDLAKSNVDGLTIEYVTTN
jgi:biopolymer transport protein ExbD